MPDPALNANHVLETLTDFDTPSGKVAHHNRGSPSCVLSWGSANPWGGSGRFDNAAAEALFSLEWELLSRNQFRVTVQPRAVVIDWCYTFCNHQRRHSAADGLSPVNYEIRENRQKP